MRDEKGKFVKGTRNSIDTEFKPGEHWRPYRQFRNKEYLLSEYCEKKRSTSDIANEWEVTDAAIIFWLRKHGIKRRSISEAREVKQWGLSGSKNGMYGRTGKDNPRWLGGISPERQDFYSSREWAAACSFVWKRDNATCQKCGAKEKTMHIHHIVSFSVARLRAEPGNLILVCADCHRWIHSKKNSNKEFIREEV